MVQLVSPRLVSSPHPVSASAAGDRGDADDEPEPLFAAPVAFGVLLGAGLGVILSALMDANANFMLRDMAVTGHLAAWCIGAALGGLSGGLLSAFIGWEMGSGAAKRQGAATAQAAPFNQLGDEPFDLEPQNRPEWREARRESSRRQS